MKNIPIILYSMTRNYIKLYNLNNYGNDDDFLKSVLKREAGHELVTGLLTSLHV